MQATNQLFVRCAVRHLAKDPASHDPWLHPKSPASPIPTTLLRLPRWRNGAEVIPEEAKTKLRVEAIRLVRRITSLFGP